MELKYLTTVKKIVETGSFQNAAAALNYAQSTITFQVRQLEGELGVQLFERRGTRMVLTQAGEELIPLIDRVLDSVEQLQSYHKTRDGLCGTLTVALPESIATYRIQRVLQEFKRRAPGVRLSLKVMNCYTIFDQMQESDIDIAIHYDVGEYPKNFVTQRLAAFPLALVCSPLLTEEERDFITPKQRKTVSYIQNDPDGLPLKLFQAYLREREIALDTTLEVWSIEGVKRSVMSDLGVACLPRFAVEEELRSGTLVELPTELDDPKVTAICVYQKGRWKSPAMELFLQLLDAHFTDGSPQEKSAQDQS